MAANSPAARISRVRSDHVAGRDCPFLSYHRRTAIVIAINATRCEKSSKRHRYSQHTYAQTRCAPRCPIVSIRPYRPNSLEK